MARPNDPCRTSSAVNVPNKAQQLGSIDPSAPDPVPLGYLTLHEAFEFFHHVLHGKTSTTAGENVEGSDEAKFFSALSKHGRQLLGAQHILGNAFQHGFLTAVVRHPKAHDWLRIPSWYWGQNFFPPRPFTGRPLSAPPRSPLGRYRGRTLLVREEAFAKWLKEDGCKHGHLRKNVRAATRATPAGETEARRQGRPPKYDWNRFVGEALRLLGLKGRPQEGSGRPNWRSKADLERAMTTWCSRMWGDEPSRSMIQQWVNKALVQFDTNPPAEK